MTNAITNKLKTKEFFGHPSGLFVLFFTEMWERMSYYGMRALLVLYMTKYLLFDPERAARVTGYNSFKSILEMGFGPLEVQPLSSQIYGLYTGFVYLSPFFGGILADKVWGRRKSVYVGAILMAIGHFLMAFESQFLLALFFLILGNGAFKPNISTQVGNLYPEGDARRDGAFTIFYMGINLGAFFSPFLCDNLANWLCVAFGLTGVGAAWHIGFSLAGFGMLLGILVYHFGRGLVPVEVGPSTLAPKEKRLGVALKTIFGFLFSMVAFLLLLMLPSMYKAIIVIAILGGIVYAIQKISDSVDRSKVAALIVLCICTIAFWAIFEQQGNTLQIWVDEKVAWESIGLRSTNYQSFNPFFIFVFAPLLTGLWESRARKGKKSSSVRKMAVGCFLAGAAFLTLSLASEVITAEKSLINLYWITLVTWIFTMGELYLSPIGLSLVTKVAPTRFLSMMMGMWFLSSFIGNYLSGFLGSFYSSMSNYAFFMIFAVLGAIVGVFFLISERKLEKIVGHGV